MSFFGMLFLFTYSANRLLPWYDNTLGKKFVFKIKFTKPAVSIVTNTGFKENDAL